MHAGRRVSIVVLNWNGWHDTIECLESLYQIEYPSFDVIVVDNASEDESPERIKEYCAGKRTVTSPFFKYNAHNKPITVLEFEEEDVASLKKIDTGYAERSPYEKLILIRNHENYGFSEGNNVAIRLALRLLDPDYVLLLNNDTTVEPRFLKELVKVSESDRTIGALGPKTFFYDSNGRRDVINFAGGKFSVWTAVARHVGINETDAGQYDCVRRVDYVEGSCLLIRRATIERIGLLDPRLFVWDDIEWCHRARERGWGCVFVPTAKIWHKVGASVGGELSSTYLYYYVRSTMLFLEQNVRWFQKPTFVSCWLVYVTSLVGRIFFKQKRPDVLFACLRTVYDALVESRHMATNKYASREFSSSP